MTQHMAYRLMREILREGGERAGLLRAKVKAERTSRLYVLLKYGDPAHWDNTLTNTTQ